MAWLDAVQSPTRDTWVADASQVVPWALAGLLLTAFLATPYLPMVDLPQHSAQVAVWMRLHDPGFREAPLFELNLGTPYLTAYAAARVLAGFVGIVPAWKFVVWVAAAAHAVAFSALVQRLGYPRWLGLLGLPLGLGYPFYFGLVSFTAAMPCILFALTAALGHREGPTLSSGLVLGALLVLTLVTHGFGLGVALMMIAPLMLRGKGSLVARAWPLVVPVLVWAMWILPARSVRTIGGTYWEPRVLELLAAPALWFAASAADHVGLIFGYVALGFVAVTLGRPSRSLERWAPLAFLVLAFCTFPLMLSGFGPLHPRFAAFFIPALLIAFEPRDVPRVRALGGSALAFMVVWLAVLGTRVVAFARETRPIRDFIAQTPPDLRVRPVVFERDSEAFPGLPALIHLPAYYMAEKGGLQGYSFAMYPTSVIRYRPDVSPGMGGGAEWHPEWFSAERELDGYDCVLVHSSVDPGALFGARVRDVALSFHEGAWWAYRVIPRAVAHAASRSPFPKEPS